MLRRNSKLAFAGGAWVFPGGRIDPEDYPDGEVSTEDDRVAQAARTAAVREAQEEAGPVVDPDGLVWFAHLTPGALAARRVATRVFMARAPAGTAAGGDGEIHVHRWIPAFDARARRSGARRRRGDPRAPLDPACRGHRPEGSRRGGAHPAPLDDASAPGGASDGRGHAGRRSRPRPRHLPDPHRPRRRRDRVDLAGRRRVRRPRHEQARTAEPVAHARRRLADREVLTRLTPRRVP